MTRRTPSAQTQLIKMTSFKALLAVVFIFATVFQSCLVHGNFHSDTYFNWGATHSSIFGNGDDLNLMLDNVSGSGVQSRKLYLFGSIEMLIKLVNSAGTLSSTGDYHDEIDFEFLGNSSGDPYTVHTNIFIQGKGNREQQFILWFDPTADFHNYTIHWNPDAVVWYVDSIPIRVYRNYKSEGIDFPDQQGMQVYSSLWNGDNWATRGGLVKIDWSCAPFKAGLRKFNARACEWNGPDSISRCAYPNQANWWTSPVYKQLNADQLAQLEWVRDNYMGYNYCTDYWRFNSQMAPECSKPQY
ncbi:putative xyloglucan:xyloglucosyl transferase [Helianthus annuus]|uniref:Xyloglucan endotransglucosylase/hydrolase n=2 Tax=Helianthus annuus TaxID=4232 RepID=A0A9K3ITM8_HELAN|nr:putative xyloglucan:xyloglucosyl transferase [Helianthus annuus]KAJ0560877.1 putative xyloglucan:xyloglucosyl transferase [Helianthus annuus]KAJ0567337.1 putative xyloglucan:xyloglucosyl transferase [Helianthus annuus]KAJ0573917.1 putative xyloglucan:xyloglucosyl transferase [Helianthus annuus]KAJ0738251.1 putative xyloglucan:xyloglucosyl transferase [Helianthus annuus]